MVISQVKIVEMIKTNLISELEELSKLPLDQLIENRYQRFRNFKKSHIVLASIHRNHFLDFESGSKGIFSYTKNTC